MRTEFQLSLLLVPAIPFADRRKIEVREHDLDKVWHIRGRRSEDMEHRLTARAEDPYELRDYYGLRLLITFLGGC